jgi:3-hydroxyacyl-[acyl-carrier-protein] dehydratase
MGPSILPPLRQFNDVRPQSGAAIRRKKRKNSGKTDGSHYNDAGLDSVAQGFMKFILIDKIVSLEEGRTLTAVKCVSLAEEYLGDHFPTFPVLPGVLLLQGLVESASWLVRKTEGFAHSMVLLQEARNVKYKSFLAPGSRIEYVVQAKTIEENVSSFTGCGTADGEKILEARFGLRHFNLADRNSAMAAVDAQVIGAMKNRYGLLTQQS